MTHNIVISKSKWFNSRRKVRTRTNVYSTSLEVDEKTFTDVYMWFVKLFCGIPVICILLITISAIYQFNFVTTQHFDVMEERACHSLQAINWKDMRITLTFSVFTTWDFETITKKEHFSTLGNTLSRYRTTSSTHWITANETLTQNDVQR